MRKEGFYKGEVFKKKGGGNRETSRKEGLYKGEVLLFNFNY